MRLGQGLGLRAARARAPHATQRPPAAPTRRGHGPDRHGGGVPPATAGVMETQANSVILPTFPSDSRRCCLLSRCFCNARQKGLGLGRSWWRWWHHGPPTRPGDMSTSSPLVSKLRGRCHLSFLIFLRQCNATTRQGVRGDSAVGVPGRVSVKRVRHAMPSSID